MAYKGRYRPKNPEKYKGNPNNVTYRSGLELSLMNFLDNHKDVIQWSSEEVIVPYRSPVDGRFHRYFTDFYVKQRDANGNIREILIEVKPKKQCSPPKVQQRKTRRYINEVTTYAVNQAKWKAATEYATARGWSFVVMTEEDIRNIK